MQQGLLVNGFNREGGARARAIAAKSQGLIMNRRPGDDDIFSTTTQQPPHSLLKMSRFAQTWPAQSSSAMPGMGYGSSVSACAFGAVQCDVGRARPVRRIMVTELL
jgi:hypothetical protein